MHLRGTIGSDSQRHFTMNWKLAEELVGPVIAVFVSVELVLSLVANVFVCVHTLSNRKSLRKSSTIFLLNLSLANLLMTVLYMPSVIVASAAKEWIFGQTDEARDITCQLFAFVFIYMVGLSLYTLAAISLDRFLSIVKPQYHKRWMTPLVAFGMVIFIWVFSAVVKTTPWMDLGEFGWSSPTGSCLPIWVGHADYVSYISIESCLPYGVIAITTVWTYVFTRNFIKKDYQQRKKSRGITEASKEEKSVYLDRKRNLIGIFGSLLIFNLLTLSPYITASIVGLIIGFNNVPRKVYTTVFILFLFSNITNPVIQSYFRKELRDSILKYWAIVKRQLCRVEVDRFVSTENPPIVSSNPQSVSTMLEESAMHYQSHTNLELPQAVAEMRQDGIAVDVITVAKDNDASDTDSENYFGVTPETGGINSNPSDAGMEVRQGTKHTSADSENDASVNCVTAITVACSESDREIHSNTNNGTQLGTPVAIGINSHSDTGGGNKEVPLDINPNNTENGT